MGLLNVGTVFITLAVLLNSIELSSQSIGVIPDPYDHPGPPSYVIQNGLVRLTGDSVGHEAIMIDGYFLGTRHGGHFRAVDPTDLNSIILIRTRRFVRVSSQFRSDLLFRHSMQTGRFNQRNRRRN